MSSSRGDRTQYLLRDLPSQDYARQLRGPPTSRRVVLALGETENSTEPEPEPVEAGIDTENDTVGMEQLATVLTSLVQLQQEQQRRWEETQWQQEEAQRQQEEQRHEEELRRQQQYSEYQDQVRLMYQQHMQQIDVMKGVLEEREKSSPHLKMAPYQETEDIQDFIEAFEGVMKIQKVNKSQWMLRLTPLLSGKARTVCTDLGATMDYDGVKKAILEHYNVNAERCRRKFRDHTWTKDQDPTEWISKGMKLMKRWLTPEQGADQMVEKIAVEQFLNGLPQEMRIWVTSQNPGTPSRVAELMESYETAHSRGSEKTRPKQDYKPSFKPKEYHKKSEGSNGHGKKKSFPGDRTCFKCNRKGHIARDCTEKNLQVQERTKEVIWHGEGRVNGRFVRRIQIDSGASRTVVDRRLVSSKDIGEESISVTFGNGTSGEYPLATVKIAFDGEEYQVRAAVVQGLAEDVLLGRDVPLHRHIARRLPKEEQVELLKQLAKEHKISIGENAEGDGTVLAVVTRAQKGRVTVPEQQQSVPEERLVPKKQQSVPEKQQSVPEEQQLVPEEQQKQQSVPEEQQSVPEKQQSVPEKQQSVPEEQQKQQSVPEEQQSVPEKQQSVPENQQSVPEKQQSVPEEQQKQQSVPEEQQLVPEEKQLVPEEQQKQQSVPEQQQSVQDEMQGSTEQLKEDILRLEFPYDQDLFQLPRGSKTHMSRNERRLHNRIRNEASDGSMVTQLKVEQEKDPEILSWMKKEDQSRIIRRDGVICRVWKPRESPDITYEQIVLPRQYRSNVIRLAHDLPFSGHLGREKTVQRILRRFYWPSLFRDVKEYCQTCAECQLHSSHKTRAPMIPLPIIGEPFRRIAMDVVGPLPRTSRGNRFILVINDYATRYPEAIPLRNVTAKKVAEVLIDLFARYGIPEEIITDQGTNFTSSLLGELYQFVGIKAIRTSPYHPQTDGLVERFNRTLKSMLRRVLAGEKRNWDRMLPYVLFAYREVPQATLGFSPFELLYGRDVRGPLDVLREEWITSSEAELDILSFVMDVKERMQLAKEIVEKNAKEVKAKQKEYYDRGTREIEFKAGDKVLLLLPSGPKKFVAKWQGPYRIVKKTGKVTYEIEMPDKGNRKQVFHVNHLKRWKERLCQVNAVIEDGEGIEGYRWVDGIGEIQFGTHLSEDMRAELQSVLKSFGTVTKDTPGRTNKIHHQIRTTDHTPIRKKPYRIPQAYLEKVMTELEEMERDGIIEKSSSEWASPLVIVTKKDGGIRLCVDYRQLNQVTKFDAYPMPRIEELLDRVGDAEFITTLDLAKGYWQVPMQEEDKEKTAFTSPRGLYQFTTMPFGLSGAPATFQRMMDNILRGTESYACVYLDDIVIHSHTWSEHIQHLTEILRQLEEAGLTIKLKKCTFGASDCTYLGYQIGGGGVLPEQRKIQAIVEMARPQTKKDVRTFLGITGYYRRFVQNYATIAEPLTELTRKNLPESITWSKRAEFAFQKLKEVLTTAPIMRNPDFQRTFILQTDASGVGVGAILSQGEGESEDSPIAYFSRKLLPREQAYSTVEKECLAIVLAVRHFRAYLLGRPFVIQTDHRALQWLHQFKEKNARLTRWSLVLQPYSFTIQHRKGKANANADALSRLERSTVKIRKEHFVPGEEGRSVRC